MKDRQFLEFMNMLEAQRLTMRQQVTDEPIIVFDSTGPSGRDMETPTAPGRIPRADQIAFDVLQFAQERNAGE